MVRLLQTSIKGLLTTRVEFPFGGTATKCSAFFVPREAGNVWIYSSSHVNDYKHHIEELGGVKHQLLNHRDEASDFSNVLEAPVFCHALEKAAIEAKGCKVGDTYEGKNFEFGNDLIAYHTPGHAVGVTSYLWKASEDTSVLFTGDSLYVNEQGELQSGPLMFHSYDGNLQDMVQSLELMLRLNPTHIVPGLIQGGEFVNEFDATRIKEIISQLKNIA